MKLKASRNPVNLAVMVMATTTPSLAFAASGGVLAFMDFITSLLTNGMTLVGAALALAGLIALGAGVWDVIQHFKPENRDNPDQKSRAVSGAVKFILGGVLATGAYQTIANSESFTASIDVPTKPAMVATVNLASTCIRIQK